MISRFFLKKTFQQIRQRKREKGKEEAKVAKS